MSDTSPSEKFTPPAATGYFQARLLLRRVFERAPIFSIAEAQGIIKAWRGDYDQRCPHSLLGHQHPNQVVAQRQEQQLAKEDLCSG